MHYLSVAIGFMAIVLASVTESPSNLNYGTIYSNSKFRQLSYYNNKSSELLSTMEDFIVLVLVEIP